jgi:hypothetical protein
MTISLPTGLGLFALIAFCAQATAEVYKPGDTFIGFKAVDQHDSAFTFKAGDAKFILFDTPGESGQSSAPSDASWFDKHHALLVVNISEFSYFKRKASHSRLESKPFRLLVLNDKGAAERFPRQPGKFTVLVLDPKGTITDVRYAAPGVELKALLDDTK